MGPINLSDKRFRLAIYACTSLTLALSEPVDGLVFSRTIHGNIDKNYVVHVFSMFLSVRLGFVGEGF